MWSPWKQSLPPPSACLALTRCKRRPERYRGAGHGPLGICVAVADAKSSRAGKVPDTAMNFASLWDHKERNHADSVMVIALAFRKSSPGVFLP